MTTTGASQRITRAMLEDQLAHLAVAMGGHVARRYDDVGGYALERWAPGDGHTFWRIEQVVSEHGGTTNPFGSRSHTARELYDTMSFARDVLDVAARQRTEVPDGH